MRKEIDITNLTEGLKRASDIIHMEGPDYIFAPVVGAVPLVDMLAVVDRHFPRELVQYLPNSSRFTNRDELMRTWYDTV